MLQKCMVLGQRVARAGTDPGVGDFGIRAELPMDDFLRLVVLNGMLGVEDMLRDRRCLVFREPDGTFATDTSAVLLLMALMA
ncbi:hypothetical protein [Streptomyces sp. NPDC048361]|uniref:hypothetical protein n=1 Tax=Streptomyces sp. NPDC048361 TaxID=3154720 RepID=UPI003430EF25